MTSKVVAKIFNSSGAQASEMELDPAVFCKTRSSIVYDAVRYQLLKKRAGTHSCLTKGEMKGGGKKPWKQKGTGRARAGSNTSPVWVGGAVAHGPKPRSYENRTPKRTRREALLAVIRDKAVNGSLFSFETLSISKTKEFTTILKSLDLADKKVLFVTDQNSESAQVKAARNIAGVTVISAKGLNTYDVINSDAMILSKDLLTAIQSEFAEKLA